MAIPFLRRAAQDNPAHYMTLSAIHKERGDEPANRESLRQAERGFRQILDADTRQHPVRIALASTLHQLGRDKEAEKLLLTGLQIKGDATIKRALADFNLMLHDQSTDFDEQLRLLQKALDFDINYVVIYQRILSQFRGRLKVDPDSAKELEELLVGSIASGEASALAHFAMSNLKSLQDRTEDAQWHIEKAYALDPKFAVIANNLAWFLAKDGETQDLDRAYELAVSVVEQVPDDPRLRDTLATVLMKQEKYDEALSQFEMVLRDIVDKKPVHKNLAFVYEKLGKPDLAEAHRKLAKQAPAFD